jgi:hypothetical protein
MRSNDIMQYTKAIQNLNTLQIKETLELLIMAGLVIPVTHTSAKTVFRLVQK